MYAHSLEMQIGTDSLMLTINHNPKLHPSPIPTLTQTPALFEPKINRLGHSVEDHGLKCTFKVVGMVKNLWAPCTNLWAHINFAAGPLYF